MDDPTKELVLRLMQDDMRDTLGYTKGKSRAGQMTDHELALEAWARELRHCAYIFEDYKMAKSLTRVTPHDSVAIAAATAEENRAFRDRIAAVQLGGLNQSAPELILGWMNAALAGITDLMGGLNLASERSRPIETIKGRRLSSVKTKSLVAESSKVAAACNPDSRTHLKSPCSHNYCRSCTRRLVHDSCIDESLFPPKCCRVPFPLPEIKTLLDKELIQIFEEKTLEYNDLNRTYCVTPSCSQYLPPTPVALTVKTCLACNTEICSTCKQQAHASLCVEREADFLKMAKKEGWQRCARCRNIVELRSGCNHITCRCGFQFCYICALKWKKCRCEVWDEHRLFDRAHQVAVRDRDNPQPARQEVQRAAQGLYEQYSCEHDGRWRRRNGQYLCDCQHCRIEACIRCRYNRL
ncbi:hypothetical protein BDV26DRAFT_304897 [Aspergillus bertholletiae]|uniref:RBR-type E3 ubiquitin transferase n=1 Tax=Aspergillus bertholletiae TaxID=1226010 RepID=A0A5N7BM21_9EURO|nr:hypothetical protein BDV26DRAFT_304897 [Aspergillus bertholletiae]